jgi:GNAT superfamily N-acetyltransferase
MSDVHIQPWQGDQSELGVAAVMYAQVFSEAPYGEDPEASRESFIERTTRYRDQLPDFRLLLAWDQVDIVGLVLGTGITTGNWWYDKVVEMLTPDQREQWMPAECYSVGELAVTPRSRGQGLGAQLMRSVVAGLPYRTALLGCDANAIPARNLYLALGWHLIADQAWFGSGAPRWLMGAALRK